MSKNLYALRREQIYPIVEGTSDVFGVFELKHRTAALFTNATYKTPSKQISADLNRKSLLVEFLQMMAYDMVTQLNGVFNLNVHKSGIFPEYSGDRKDKTSTMFKFHDLSPEEQEIFIQAVIRELGSK